MAGLDKGMMSDAEAESQATTNVHENGVPVTVRIDIVRTATAVVISGTKPVI